MTQWHDKGKRKPSGGIRASRRRRDKILSHKGSEPTLSIVKQGAKEEKRKTQKGLANNKKVKLLATKQAAVTLPKEKNIQIVGRHFPEKSGPLKPKVIFTFGSHNKASKKLESQILRKYGTRKAVQTLKQARKWETETMRIREKFFGKVRRGLPLDRKPRPLPKKKPF